MNRISPESLIAPSGAIARSTSNRKDTIMSAFALAPMWKYGWTAAVIGGVTLASAVQFADCASTDNTPARAQIVATFTGEFDNGTPVYRLPSITVVAHRKAAVAKTERQRSDPRQTRKG